MGAQAKIINMLLYDGTLGGVIRIEDSSWNAGELFSAPRNSVSDLFTTGACNKYGVYLLLSVNMVYIGQSSDLAKRINQHVAKKEWWESVIILTTKDDSLNHSDIDYLENVLIDKAFAIQKLDCDNKKSGNPPKVDIFRKTYLNQYLEEALFLMELIGIRVFKSEKPHQKKKKRGQKSPTISIKSTPTVDNPSNINPPIPPLPDASLKIGQYVYTTIKNLSESGFLFTQEAIDDMTTSEWSAKTFHTKYPFLKIFVAESTDTKWEDGRVRFKATPYTFGNIQVLISKEWHESQRQYFNNWYLSLKL